MATKTTAVAVKPTETALTKQVNMLVAQAQGFVLATNDDLERCGEIRANIKAGRATVKEVLGEQVETAFAAHKKAKEKFNQYDEPLKQADVILASKQGDYIRRLQAEKAAADRKAQLEAEAEAVRIAEELKVQQAQNLMEAGRIDEAQECIEQPTYVEPVKVKSEIFVPKIDMRTIGREKFRVNVINLKALIDAVSKGTVPVMALEVNQKFADSQAKYAKDTSALGWPGCVVVKE